MSDINNPCIIESKIFWGIFLIWKAVMNYNICMCKMNARMNLSHWKRLHHLLILLKHFSQQNKKNNLFLHLSSWNTNIYIYIFIYLREKGHSPVANDNLWDRLFCVCVFLWVIASSAGIRRPLLFHILWRDGAPHRHANWRGISEDRR